MSRSLRLGPNDRVDRASHGPATLAAMVLAAAGAGSGSSAGAAQNDGGPPRPCDSARACYELGRQASGPARRQRFTEGMALARGRLDRRADDPEGLYWLAVNTGAEALERGKMRALPALPEMERLLLACHQVAPTYEHGGPARVLGRLYHKAPALISIGSNAKARQWLETALALAPDYPGNLAFAADFLADARELPRAVELARRCLSALDAHPGAFGPEGEEWRTLARAVVEAGA